MQAPIFKNFEKSFSRPFRAFPTGFIGVNLPHCKCSKGPA
nr:MAG TPA: hypothetical protein [Caudoviricetes sp.]